ncbi:blue light receptor [Lambiella insularis]|nr:blue light receptor [Lambiella insularis]
MEAPPSAGQVAHTEHDDTWRCLSTSSNSLTGNADVLSQKIISRHADYKDNLIYPGLYAPSGFDMMSILVSNAVVMIRVGVAMRPNPQVDLGAIDASCALLLCDAAQPDSPVVYCSEAFERLTGYTQKEVIGLNCRFLQAPDGNVQAGVKRTHVDNEAVFRLKKRLLAFEEAQTSLVNYKKGGQPFTNLLTTVPIFSKSITAKYIVGFLADIGDHFWIR